MNTSTPWTKDDTSSQCPRYVNEKYPTYVVPTDYRLALPLKQRANTIRGSNPRHIDNVFRAVSLTQRTTSQIIACLIQIIARIMQLMRLLLVLPSQNCVTPSEHWRNENMNPTANCRNFRQFPSINDPPLECLTAGRAPTIRCGALPLCWRDTDPLT